MNTHGVIWHLTIGSVTIHYTRRSVASHVPADGDQRETTFAKFVQESCSRDITVIVKQKSKSARVKAAVITEHIFCDAASCWIGLEYNLVVTVKFPRYQSIQVVVIGGRLKH